MFENGGKVYVDGKEINDYTSEEGSTIIKLSDKYLSSLGEGEHILRVVFNNGESATTKFTVSRLNNPNTVDNIFTHIILSLISLVGLCIVPMCIKKRNNRN